MNCVKIKSLGYSSLRPTISISLYCTSKLELNLCCQPNQQITPVQLLMNVPTPLSSRVQLIKTFSQFIFWGCEGKWENCITQTRVVNPESTLRVTDLRLLLEYQNVGPQCAFRVLCHINSYYRSIPMV